MLIAAFVLLSSLSSPLGPAISTHDNNSNNNNNNNVNEFELTDAVASAVTAELIDDDPMSSQRFVDEQKLASTCVDYTIDGHYYNRQYQTCQRSGFVRRPATISACELEQLHKDCVDRINMYRSGQIRFTNGGTDSVVTSGLSSLRERKGSNQCSSAGAMGDLIANYEGGGGCAGAHNNAFVCGGGSVAQNSCCGRGAGAWGTWDTQKMDTYDKVKGELFGCLQAMWDEGQTAQGGGHWRNMRNSAYAHVSCGFAWSADGRVMMTQDFTSGASSCSPSCSSCGGSDGCSSHQCVCQGSSADTTVSSGGCSGTAASSSPSPSRPAAASATATRSPASSPSGSPSRSPAMSPSRTPAMSLSRSPAMSPSRTPAASNSQLPSASPSPTRSTVPSTSAVPSRAAASSTPSATSSATRTTTPSITPSHSLSVAPAAVASASASRIASPSSSPSLSPSSSFVNSDNMGMGMDMGMEMGMEMGMGM